MRYTVGIGKVLRVGEGSSEDLLKFLCELDDQAEFMLYSPGERKINVHDLRGHIRSLKDNSAIFIYRIKDVGIVSYLALYGGRMDRNSHVASLSCGTLKEWRCRGLASRLWGCAIEHSLKVGIEKIELTVVCKNYEAISLYFKWGFCIEGLRKESWRKNKLASLEDEFYMAYALNHWEYGSVG